MRYMCLVYVEHGAMERLSEAEMTALTDASIEADYDGDAKGMLVCSGPLAPPETAVTIAAQPAWKRSPAGVRLSLRVERCSSVTPMSVSSARICWLTAEVLVRSCRAAAAKLPCRMTLANTAMRLSWSSMKFV